MVTPSFVPFDQSSLGEIKPHRLKDLISQGTVEEACASQNTTNQNAFVLAGYPDDEGIKNNGGRLGASEAPDAVRRVLYSMAPSCFHSHRPPLMDVGNLQTKDIDILTKHESALQVVQKTLSADHKWIALGGGHDYAYADGAGFLQWFASTQSQSSAKPLILNFDAHLDVRSDEQGINSGTPFFRLLRDFPQGFELVQIGIQSHCNSKEHFDWCTDQNISILTWEDIGHSSQPVATTVLSHLKPFLTPLRPCFLSLDMDGFSSAYAMGCSQSWPTGFDPESFLSILNTLKKILKINCLGVYEVSPPLDLDGRTTKLAAKIIHSFIYDEAKSG